MENIKYNIPDSFISKWQNIVNLVAKVIHIPTALIMKIVDKDIQVFISSTTEGNPYKPGDKDILLGSGLYCETVIKNNNKLLVPNALKDIKWKNNPDIKLNMISYLGFPIHMPNNEIFGTICVLDKKENNYSNIYEDLIFNIKGIIENDLNTIYMNKTLGEENKNITEYADELKQLRGLLRICAKCKKVLNEENLWISVEKYIEGHSEAEFSHGLCPECMEKMYGDKEWFKRRKRSS